MKTIATIILFLATLPALAQTVPVPLVSGIPLSAPRQYYVCDANCRVTPPVPAAGYEFCIMGATATSATITLAPLGAGAMYEKTDRTGYGTASTGTMVSGGNVGDRICIIGRDATHYVTISFAGTWGVN